MSESLLPGTDAMTCNTLQWNWEGSYRAKFLVRYRDIDGCVFQTITPDWKVADGAFEKHKSDMAAKTAAEIRSGTWPRRKEADSR